MKQAWFHLHPPAHPEVVWGGLVFLVAFLVVLLVVMAALFGWQLPTVQPSWSGDLFKPIPTPFGPY